MSSENSIFALIFSLRTSFAVVCLSYMIIGRRETLKKIRSHTLSIVTTVFHIFIDDFLPHLDASASASVYKAICFRFISPLISLLFATYLGWDVFLFLFRSTTKIPDLLLTRLRFDGDKHRRATPIWIFFFTFSLLMTTTRKPVIGKKFTQSNLKPLPMKKKPRLPGQWKRPCNQLQSYCQFSL